MQVNVIQAKDITFKKWRWWSDWIDIVVFEDSCRCHLLQMRVSRTNAKQFNSIPLTPIYRHLFASGFGGASLTQMEKK